MARYILTYGNNDDGVWPGKGNKLRLIGPFDNRAALSAWGRAWQDKHDDDPRWQEVEIEPTFLSEVRGGGLTIIIPVEPPSAA